MSSAVRCSCSIQPLHNAGVEVDNRCVADALFAWCDANRLQQVLINLIGNTPPMR